MSRPDDRPLRRLPQLEARKATFERCVFCPKLCRSACPVSNAEPRETLTPWGKMSMAYFAANESVPVTPSYAAPAWACTGCFGCREHCDHKNDVTGTLFESRSALASDAPAGAKRVLAEFDESVLGASSSVVAETALLLGCENARAKNVDSQLALEKLVGPVETINVCCGAPLLYAGDRARFLAQGERFRRATAGKRVIASDAGCASTLRVHLGIEVLHFVEVVAQHVDRLGHIEMQARWHDPCQLGRGLGVYEQPRAILTKILGRAPAEFIRNRADARCSGAGGLLPVTMPEVSKDIARSRIDDHVASGGGTIVTACASSQRSFKRAGADVVDIATLVARALR